jgi:aminoglycoside/choline kinase family phosphotransferase
MKSGEETVAAAADDVARWLSDHGLVASAVKELAGDVSARRYFRVRLRGRDRTAIVASYPTALASAQSRFSRAAALLTGAGVRVPAIEIDDGERRMVLLEDLGRATLHELASGWEERAPELDAALEAQARIERLPAEAVTHLGSPPLDGSLLAKELSAVRTLLLEPAGLASADQTASLEKLCDRLGAPPLVPCHRDLMARNLIPLGDGEIGLLDFQDLRLGPSTYDVASLLNDSLFAQREVEERVLSGRFDGPQARLQYGRAVVQRCLKATGTFLSFAERGDARHLSLVGPCVARAAAWLGRIPETAVAWSGLEDTLRAAGDRRSVC